jgi:hypothetical protein
LSEWNGDGLRDRLSPCVTDQWLRRAEYRFRTWAEAKQEQGIWGTH